MRKSIFFNQQVPSLLWKTESFSVMSDPLRSHGLYSQGILQARILEWVTYLFFDLPDSGIKLVSPALQADSFPAELNLLSPAYKWNNFLSHIIVKQFLIICSFKKMSFGTFNNLPGDLSQTHEGRYVFYLPSQTRAQIPKDMILCRLLEDQCSTGI